MHSISLRVSSFLVTLISLAFVVAATAQTLQTNTLESFKAIYDGATARIVADTQRQKDEASVQYGKNLDTILKALRQKGDIDNFTLAVAEVSRPLLLCALFKVRPAVQQRTR